MRECAGGDGGGRENKKLELNVKIVDGIQNGDIIDIIISMREPSAICWKFLVLYSKNS